MSDQLESEVCRRHECERDALQKVQIDMKDQSTQPFPTLLCGPCLNEARESEGAEITEVLDANVA